MGLFNNLKLAKANMLYSQGNIDEACKIYIKLFDDNNLNIPVLLQGAYACLNCGNLQYTKKFLDRINIEKITDDNLKISYTQTKSLYLWKTGDITTSISNLKALHKEYENTITYETLGYLLIVNKDYKEALEYNLKALEYSKSNVILDNLAESYYYLDDIDKSYEIYENMLINNENTPSFAETYYYFGLILEKQGKIKEAIEYLNKALQKKESFLSVINKDTIKK